MTTHIVTLEECVRQAVHIEGFVEHYDRLTGSHFGSMATRSPIDIMVDEATGHDMEEAAKFVAFVKEFVFDTFPGPKVIA